MKKKGNNILTH